MEWVESSRSRQSERRMKQNVCRSARGWVQKFAHREIVVILFRVGVPGLEGVSCMACL